MQKTEVKLVCDVCGRDEGELSVSKRTVRIDGNEVEAEVCESDWPGEKLEQILRAGRKPGRAPRVVVG